MRYGEVNGCRFPKLDSELLKMQSSLSGVKKRKFYNTLDLVITFFPFIAGPSPARHLRLFEECMVNEVEKGLSISTTVRKEVFWQAAEPFLEPSL